MAKTRERLEELGKRILGTVRKELYFDMPYLAYAIGSLVDVMDLSTRTVGTDATAVRFNPGYLFEMYLQRPGKLNRAYMHMLMHNLLLHPFKDISQINIKGLPKPEAEDERELWDLCCDIAVESVIDSMEVPCLQRITSDYRNVWYEKIAKEIRAVSAERLYRFFIENPVSGEEMLKLKKEFYEDDHGFWERLRSENEKEDDLLDKDLSFIPMTDFPLKAVWERAGKAVAVESELSGNEATAQAGRFTWSMKLLGLRQRDYRSLLEKYMVRREVAATDPEEFDLAYYCYGMDRYGNMPLIEELEGREEKRMDALVIALDTSASTKRKHIQKFITETAGILNEHDSFFEDMDVHIIECDDHVQKDIAIKKLPDMDAYSKEFEVSGGYGTDYRPVFFRVEELRSRGQLKNIRALLYFTDGYGIYPGKVTDYETVFVFLKDEDYDDTGVPDWAIKVYLE